MFSHRLDHSRLLALSSAALPTGQLVALAPIANEALKGEALPVRLKLFNWGVNETTSKGRVTVGANTLKSLAANQAKFGYDTIALDYGHNSLPGHPNFQADPRKVAGYGKPEVIEGDGLYVTALSYTPSGKEHAPEYHDLSPTPLLDEHGEVIFLHSVALCPQGEVKGLTFYSADFLNPTAMKFDPKKSLLSLLSLAPVLAIAGLKPLAADASDADLEAAFKTASEKLNLFKLPEAKEDKTVALTGLEALTASVEELKKQLAEQAEMGRRTAILDQALRDGKVVPLAAGKLPFADFEALVKELPANQVPLDQRTPAGLQALTASGVGQGNAMEAEICRNLGITPEKLAKTK